MKSSACVLILFIFLIIKNITHIDLELINPVLFKIYIFYTHKLLSQNMFFQSSETGRPSYRETYDNSLVMCIRTNTLPVISI